MNSISMGKYTQTGNLKLIAFDFFLKSSKSHGFINGLKE
jgi:hypothetical protein